MQNFFGFGYGPQPGALVRGVLQARRCLEDAEGVKPAVHLLCMLTTFLRVRSQGGPGVAGPAPVAQQQQQQQHGAALGPVAGGPAPFMTLQDPSALFAAMNGAAWQPTAAATGELAFGSSSPSPLFIEFVCCPLHPCVHATDAQPAAGLIRSAILTSF